VIYSNEKVSLLVQSQWERHVVRVSKRREGRLLLVWLKVQSHTCLLAVAYMPTGLDGKAPGSPELKTACSIAKNVVKEAGEVDLCFFMADMNETTELSGRSMEGCKQRYTGLGGLRGFLPRS
jgi:hypothetical protein